MKARRSIRNKDFLVLRKVRRIDMGETGSVARICAVRFYSLLQIPLHVEANLFDRLAFSSYRIDDIVGAPKKVLQRTMATELDGTLD